MSLTPYIQVNPDPLSLNLSPVISSATFTSGGVTASGGYGIIGHGMGIPAELVPTTFAQLSLSVTSGGSSSSASSANFGYVGA